MTNKRMVNPPTKARSADRANGSSYRPKSDGRARMPVVRPIVTPPVTPPTNNPWDFAFITIGDFTQDTEVWVDGNKLPAYDAYANSLETSQDFYEWLAQRLFPLGIGMYTTYDSYGSSRMYRFQNLANATRNIEFINSKDSDNWQGIVVLALTPDVVNPSVELLNPTITTANPTSETNNYSHVTFTLAPNTKPELVGVSPSNVMYHSFINSFPMQTIAVNTETSTYGDLFEYRVLINDVAVKKTSGSEWFTLREQADLMEFSNLLELQGLYFNSQYTNSTRTQLRYGFSTVDEDDRKLYKITIIQKGDFSRRDENDNISLMELDGISWMNFNREHTPDTLTYTAYLYDPLDIMAMT